MLDWLQKIEAKELAKVLYYWNQQSPELWAKYTEADKDLPEYAGLLRAIEFLKSAVKHNYPVGFRGARRRYETRNKEPR